MADYLDSSSLHSSDSATLALLGKKQVLKRRFGLVSLVGFAICELITWETVLALFSTPLFNGGPSATIFGYIIAWASTLSVYICIAELASMAPIAAGQYYWVFMLASSRWRVLASYIIGWLTSLAWVATVATECLFAGLMLQSVVFLNHESYLESEPPQWHVVLLTFAVIFVCIVINIVIPQLLPHLATGSMILHIASFFGIWITLLVLSPKASASYVWTSSNNGGEWPTLGLSVCVGFLGNVATFVGADASVHMAEETREANKVIPRAIVIAMLVNGAVGFAMMLAVLYSLGLYPDVDTLLDGALFPFIQIFQDVTRNTAGATAMSSIVLYLTWICANGITTTASRMVWSFARDKALPFSSLLMRLDRNKIPYVSVLVVTILAAALTSIYAGSETAFNDVVSLTITGFYSSYFLPLALLLNHRIRGRILPHGTVTDSSSPPSETEKPATVEAPTAAVELANAPLVWGPWRIPGALGTINNAYACTYIVFVLFWSVWPPEAATNYNNMNYSIVVTGGIMILAGLWYWIHARLVYRGPIVESEVAEMVRVARANSIH